MILSAKAAALAATTMAAASAAGWWAVWPDRPEPLTEDVRAVGTSPGQEPVEPPDDVTLCVGPPPDRILRATREDGSCPAGHRELRLAEEDEGICELCDPDDPPKPEDPNRNRLLDGLERRIESLEKSAYFEVVTKDGKDGRPVFRVAPGGVRVFNAAAVAVAAIGTTEEGGYFTGRSTGDSGYASIGASGSRGGVRLLESDVARLELKVQEGRASLRVPWKTGLIAGIGESSAGTGALLTGTFSGSTRASLTVPDGRGMIATNGQGPSGGSALLEARIGGGMFGLDDTKGRAVVKMGHNANRYGIVLAGPTLGFPLIPKSGLPGSYFLGCATAVRPACVPAIDP
jgi:hypothetical protein